MKPRNRWIVAGLSFIFLTLGIGGSSIYRLRKAIELYSHADAADSQSSSPNASRSGKSQGDSGPGAVAFAAAHLTPILFYGKVMDQDGNPVAGADVEYSGNNIPWGGAACQQMKTDANGEFRITTSGLSLSVNVSKENYRSLLRRSDIPPEEAAGDPSSSDSFNYAKLFGPTVHKPDNAHPVVFTLYKSGELEHLIIQPGKDLVMAKDGSPIRVALNPGNSKTVIEIQCWTDDKNPNAERHYDWRFKITVLSGGLEERLDEIAFIAPPSGYEERSFEYSMKKELPGNQWKDEVAKSFFVRFEDDTYAILDVNMISGGGHFAVVSSRLNPKPGSRNLETAAPKKPKYR